MKNIYTMKLHETLTDVDNPGKQGEFFVLRVPGGWIYSQWRDGIPHPVFVPYSQEYIKELFVNAK